MYRLNREAHLLEEIIGHNVSQWREVELEDTCTRITINYDRIKCPIVVPIPT